MPAVLGWLRPVVLAPVGALTGLPAEHVEALLAHELAHIRRNDYLVNLLQGVALPPTDLAALCERLGVSRIVEDDVPFSGALRRCGETFEVVCSRYLSPDRRRFTIAHELAHLVLDSNLRRCGLRSGRELERLCDMLAAELLMPRGVFFKLTDDCLSLKSILQASRLFETSLAATSIRFSELYGAVVFEIENGSLSWSRGLRSIDGTLREAVEDTLSGRPVETPLFVRIKGSQRRCFLEGVRIGEKRGLFLILPSRTKGGSAQVSPTD